MLISTNDRKHLRANMHIGGRLHPPLQRRSTHADVLGD